MAEGKIVRRGGGGKKTAAPTITEVSKTHNTITFTVTNNDAATATVYYDFDDEVTSLSEDNVTLATTATSDNIEVTGLTAETQYTIYSVASAFNKMFSPQTSLAITTEAAPLVYLELLNDSGTLGSVGEYAITGLNIGKTENLILYYDVPNSGDGNIYVRFNSLPLSSHATQRLFATASNSSFDRITSDYRVGYHYSSAANSGFVTIKLNGNGYITGQSQNTFGYQNPSSVLQIYDSYGTTNTTASSITSLLIDLGQFSNPTGARFRLYKVVD